MLKGAARFAGVLLLICSSVFAQSVAASAATGEDPEGRSLSAPTADDNAAQLQPFLLASYGSYSSSRAAFDTEPLVSPASFARPDPIVRNEPPKPRVHWKPALWQSARFLLVMHAFRLATEPSSRAELKGPFW